jgi:hypothetical protein
VQAAQFEPLSKLVERYIFDKGRFTKHTHWALTGLLNPSATDKIPGAEQIICVPPRQLRSIYNVLAKPREPHSPLLHSQLLEDIWTLFVANVDEDPYLGIPAQRALKRIWSGALLTVSSIVIGGHFGERLDIPISTTATDAIRHVGVSTVVRRKLQVTNWAKSGEARSRELAPDTTSMFMLIHDMCAMSTSTILIGSCVWDEQDCSSLAHTARSDSPRVPWLLITWPTFWHEQVFLSIWNAAVTLMGRVQREVSSISDSDIAALLAFGFCGAVIKAWETPYPQSSGQGKEKSRAAGTPGGPALGGTDYPMTSDASKQFGLSAKPEAAIEGHPQPTQAPALKYETKRTASSGSAKIDKWELNPSCVSQGDDRKWVFSSEWTTASGARMVEEFADGLERRLTAQLGRGAEDAHFRFGIDIIAQLRWMLGDQVGVLAQTIKGFVSTPDVATRVELVLEDFAARLVVTSDGKKVGKKKVGKKKVGKKKIAEEAPTEKVPVEMPRTKKKRASKKTRAKKGGENP